MSVSGSLVLWVSESLSLQVSESQVSGSPGLWVSGSLSLRVSGSYSNILRLGDSETQIMNCTKPGDSIIAYFDVWILNKISWILGGGVAYMGAGLRRRPQKTPRKSFVLAPVPLL